MEQTTWDYELLDDNGSSLCESVPVLIPVGGTFTHEYGTYKVIEHLKKTAKCTDGTIYFNYIKVFCDRL